MKKQEQKPHVFEVGDLVNNQRGEFKVILKVKPDCYEYIELVGHSVKTITHGTLEWKKGQIGDTNPFYIFDKYHYLYELK